MITRMMNEAQIKSLSEDESMTSQSSLEGGGDGSHTSNDDTQSSSPQDGGQSDRPIPPWRRRRDARTQMNVEDQPATGDGKRSKNKIPAIFTRGTVNNKLWQAYVASNQANTVKLPPTDQSPLAGDGFGVGSALESLAENSAMEQDGTVEELETEGTVHQRKQPPLQELAPPPPGPSPQSYNPPLMSMTPTSANM